MSTNPGNPQDQAMTNDESDAQWAKQFAATAPVLDALAKDVMADMATQPFVDDESW